MQLVNKWKNVPLLNEVVTFKNEKGYFTVLKAKDEKVLIRNHKNEYFETSRENARKAWVKFKNSIPKEWLKNYIKKTHKFKTGQIITGKELNGYKDFNIIHSATYVDHVHECKVEGNLMYLKYNDDQGIAINANEKYEIIEANEENFSIQLV